VRRRARPVNGAGSSHFSSEIASLPNSWAISERVAWPGYKGAKGAAVCSDVGGAW
jgi:hypothetical protein